MTIAVKISQGIAKASYYYADGEISVRNILSRYEIPYDGMGITVNGDVSTADRIVGNGDKVALTIPVTNNLYGVADTGYYVMDHGYMDQASALLAIGVGLVATILAAQEYKEATDFLEEVNDRRLEMSRQIYEHQMTVTYPMQRSAMDEAFAMPVFAPDKYGQCVLFKQEMMQSLSRANQAQSHYNNLFCIKNPSCNNELGYYAGIAASEQSFFRGQQQDLRYVRNLEAKTEAIHHAHAGTFRSPTSIFGLLENAAATAGYIQGQAFSNLNGSLAMFSMGVNGLINSFGSNS